MLRKLILIHHETVILNSPGRETLSAGLGPIEQYGVILIVLIIAVIVYFIRKKRKKKAS